jgi:hypothetical protein
VMENVNCLITYVLTDESSLATYLQALGKGWAPSCALYPR